MRIQSEQADEPASKPITLRRRYSCVAVIPGGPLFPRVVPDRRSLGGRWGIGGRRSSSRRIGSLWRGNS
jgi:hypothetical protein